MSARHRIVVTWLLSSATAFADAPPAAHAPHAPPPADGHATARLLALREELAAVATDAEMTAKLAHFRPLCDADGYPLVGNIITKGDGPKMKPSKLCAVVREREHTKKGST